MLIFKSFTWMSSIWIRIMLWLEWNSWLFCGHNVLLCKPCVGRDLFSGFINLSINLWSIKCQKIGGKKPVKIFRSLSLHTQISYFVCQTVQNTNIRANIHIREPQSSFGTFTFKSTWINNQNRAYYWLIFCLLSNQFISNLLIFCSVSFNELKST